jgi:integrase
MSNQKAKTVVLPSFSLTETCDEEDDGSTKVVIPKITGADSRTYFRRNLCAGNRSIICSDAYRYNFFPIVLCADGSPWKEGNLFILSILEGFINPVMATVQSIASDLADYKNYLDQEGIDPFEFPKRKLLRPTYRYRNFNVLKAQAGEVSLGTAKRRVSRVVSFYNWVINESIAVIENSPWTEKSVHISIKNRHGAAIFKKVKSTDLSIKTLKSENPYSETIQDGSELKPLVPSEQVVLFEALSELGNVEMTLIHLIAFYTGARAQTVLTLRASIFQHPIDSSLEEVRVKVGPGTGVDTKNDKLMVLFFPIQLYEKIRIYTLCGRLHQRKLLAKDEHLDYLFLTNRGTPYYDSKYGISTFNEDNTKRRPNNGQGVRQFIGNKLIPLIRRKPGFEGFRYKFHDIRATYGLNLTNAQINLVQKRQTNLHKAREFVRSRMGHTSASTTDLYLQYRDNLKLIRKAQLDYEEHIVSLMGKSLEGADELH